MLITSVELHNYKSYADATVRFRPGTNAITGPNGSGKSTLLEAIGFVLFGYRPDSLANCLREGTESGSAAVGIVSSYDERDYVVERSFTSRATTRYRVLDTELGSVVLAEGKDDVQAWLRQHLRVSPAAALEALFENAVGVPQGTYTAPFQQPASARKAVFDPLLQVEEYALASDRLLEPQRRLSEILQTLAEQIARAEGRLARLPELEREQAALADALARLDAEIASLAGRLTTAQAERDRWDAAEARLREATQRAERAEAEWATAQRLLEHAEHSLEEALAAAERLQAARPGHVAYLRAEARLRELEERRSRRDGLREERSRSERDLARLQERAQALGRSLAEMEEAAYRMEALQPLVRRQEELEAALLAAQQEAQQLETARREEARCAQELRRAEQEAEACRQGLARASDVQRRLGELRARMERLTEEGQAWGADRARAEAEVERLDELVRILSSSETARCPVCEGELTPAHRAELLDRHQAQLAHLRAEVERTKARIAAHRREYQRLSSEAQALERQLRDLPAQTALARLEQDVERRRVAWEQARQSVAGLAAAPERVTQVAERLGALGDPRREYQRCQDRAAQREHALAERARVDEETQHLAQEAERLDAELAAYEGLDDDLRQARAARAAHQTDHDTYLANEQAAGQVQPRTEQVATARAALAVAQEERHRTAQERDAAASGYDATAHRNARDAAASVERDLASARARRQERSERQQAVQHELAELREVAATLAEWRAEEQEQSRRLDMLRTVRDLLRKAGPYITQQLVRQISREASRLYGDIMGDYTGQLHWSEDYDLTLETRGHVRGFRQLSGGEQMSAALAVRLAALRETSAIDVALFDEPTAHLDPDRRDSLADSIVQIKGFAQLFVISHDDTFERAAQHYVRIRKDERGSRPEVDQVP